MRRAVVAVLGVALAAVGAAASAPNPSLFAYDRNAPVELTWGTEESFGDVVQRELTFRGADGKRVAGYFVRPARSGPWPLVLWSPGLNGDRTADLPDAFGIARKGIASLLVDPPRTRLITCNARKDLASYVAYVVGRRRALDVVPSLLGVDADRVAAVGFSFGTSVSGTLSGVEDRVRAYVLQSGRGHHTGWTRASCSYLGKRKLAAYVKTVGVVDPVRWLGRAAPAALLFQNGTQDPGIPRADATAAFNVASKPKELRWYRAGHPLNAAAHTYRDAWLVRQLSR
jgi:fermentation-respiration switch protein FrsA (DUF1100 family)